jgi:hypothetical protein
MVDCASECIHHYTNEVTDGKSRACGVGEAKQALCLQYKVTGPDGSEISAYENELLQHLRWDELFGSVPLSDGARQLPHCLDLKTVGDRVLTELRRRILVDETVVATKAQAKAAAAQAKANGAAMEDDGAAMEDESEGDVHSDDEDYLGDADLSADVLAVLMRRKYSLLAQWVGTLLGSRLRVHQAGGMIPGKDGGSARGPGAACEHALEAIALEASDPAATGRLRQHSGAVDGGVKSLKRLCPTVEAAECGYRLKKVRLHADAGSRPSALLLAMLRHDTPVVATLLPASGVTTHAVGIAAGRVFDVCESHALRLSLQNLHRCAAREVVGLKEAYELVRRQ